MINLARNNAPSPTEAAKAEFRKAAAELACCEQCGWTGPWNEVEQVQGDSAGFYGLLQRCPDCGAAESF